MNADEMKTVTKSLAKLFASFPQSATADVDMQARSYLDALSRYDARDVLVAIERFCKGEVPGANLAFCPSTAQLADQARWVRRFREGQERQQLRLVKG